MASFKVFRKSKLNTNVPPNFSMDPSQVNGQQNVGLHSAGSSTKHNVVELYETLKSPDELQKSEKENPIPPTHALESAVVLSKWGVGWKAPALMYGLYLCGMYRH